MGRYHDQRRDEDRPAVCPGQLQCVKPPGFDNTPAYLRTGAIVDVDYRDEPGNPRAGGRYTARVSAFKDLDLGLHDFTQYDFDVQQYIPFFNQRRVIALRARTTLTRTADSEAIPFYMLPTIGGSDDVRGFEDFRFRDRNAVVLNAEYRWEAFSGMDVALFGCRAGRRQG